jgi:hypothetical protein
MTRKLDRILTRPNPQKASQMMLPASPVMASNAAAARRIPNVVPMEVSVRPSVPAYSGMSDAEDEHELPAFLRLKANRS